MSYGSGLTLGIGHVVLAVILLHHHVLLRGEVGHEIVVGVHGVGGEVSVAVAAIVAVSGGKGSRRSGFGALMMFAG